MALTDSWLKSVYGKPVEKQFEKADRDGLSARVNITGKVIFQMRYRHNKKRVRFDLGTYPLITLKQARAEALRYQAELEQGNDPRIVKRLEKKANTEAMSVDDLFDKWFEAYCVEHHKHPDETKRQYQRHVQPALGDLPFEKISVHDWFSFFENLAKKYSSTAKACLTTCKSIAQWSARRKLIAYNPIADIKAKSDLKIKNNEVERVLTALRRFIWI